MSETNNGEIILIPETHASQISDSQLELDPGEVLIYFKFITMTNAPIKRVNFDVTKLLGECPGFFTFNKIEKLRPYFHKVLDQLLDGASSEKG